MTAFTHDEIKALCERFDLLYTGALIDIMDEMGLRNQTLPSHLLPLRPGMRLSGAAFPVLGRQRHTTDYDDSIRRILQMLGEVTPYSIVIYESNDDTAAHLGELSVVALKMRQCRGAVVDGGVRDVHHILQEDFPVFCRYTTPSDGPPRWECVDWNVPIVIGNVRVEPGDFIVGDLDGVVAVPARLAIEVLEKAEELVATENAVRDAIRQGALPLEAYDRFGRF